MPELFGPLPRHAIADLPLIAAILLPLAGSAVAWTAGSWLDDRAALRALASRLGAPRPTGVVVALGCAMAALVALLGLVGAAGAGPGLLVSPGWILTRLGSIDAMLGVDLDPGRGVVALAACVLGAGHALRAGGRDVGAAARTGVLTGGVVAASSADGIATAVLGLGLVLAASAGPARGARWAAGAAASVLLVVGGATLAWSLEGRWLHGLRGDYLSDYGPRIIAVRDAPTPPARPRGAAAADGRGSLTMTSTPGAEVHTGVADESTLRTRRAPVGTSPFRGAAVPAVLHKIAVVPGGGAVIGGEGFEVALVDTVDVRAGDDVVLQPVGATITWRDVQAQLLLADATSRHPLRSELAAKTIGGVTAPTAVLLLLFLAALAALVDLPRRVTHARAAGGRVEAALVAGAVAIAAVVPAARAGGLVPLAASLALVVVAGAILVGGVASARDRGPSIPGAAAVVAGAVALLAVTADAGELAAPIAALAAVAAFALSAPLAAIPASSAGASSAGDAPAGASSTRTPPAAPAVEAPAGRAAPGAPRTGTTGKRKRGKASRS